jgi:hypothetical protein
VVGEDGSFEAVIAAKNPKEGVTFKRVYDGGEFVIDFADFSEYDLYPRGDTIKRLAAKKGFAQTEQLLETSKTEEELHDEEHFFVLFDRLQNTSLGDQHMADILIAEMKDIAHDKKELTEALGWAIDRREPYLNEAAAI